jgi:hypothetical protein
VARTLGWCITAPKKMSSIGPLKRAQEQFEGDGKQPKLDFEWFSK